MSDVLYLVPLIVGWASILTMIALLAWVAYVELVLQPRRRPRRPALHVVQDDEITDRLRPRSGLVVPIRDRDDCGQIIGPPWRHGGDPDRVA